MQIESDFASLQQNGADVGMAGLNRSGSSTSSSSSSSSSSSTSARTGSLDWLRSLPLESCYLDESLLPPPPLLLHHASPYAYVSSTSTASASGAMSSSSPPEPAVSAHFVVSHPVEFFPESDVTMASSSDAKAKSALQIAVPPGNNFPRVLMCMPWLWFRVWSRVWVRAACVIVNCS